MFISCNQSELTFCITPATTNKVWASVNLPQASKLKNSINELLTATIFTAHIGYTSPKTQRPCELRPLVEPHRSLALARITYSLLRPFWVIYLWQIRLSSLFIASAMHSNQTPDTFPSQTVNTLEWFAPEIVLGCTGNEVIVMLN